MVDIRWDAYPHVAASETARAWLQMQAHLRLAPKTVAAYGESLNDYLSFYARCRVPVTAATREQVAAYVHPLGISFFSLMFWIFRNKEGEGWMGA